MPTNSLSMYQNLQYNAIPIQDFCVVEVYHDSIIATNAYGYFIQPLAGVTNPETTIRTRVLAALPSTGYTNLVILSGRDFSSWSRKRVYAVFYNGDTAPTYPAAPEEVDPGVVSDAFVFEDTFTIINNGNLTECDILLTLSSLDEVVEFKLNDAHYAIDVTKQIPKTTNTVKINSQGVFFNETPIDTFTMTETPRLLPGDNILKVSKLTISHVKVDYQYTL